MGLIWVRERKRGQISGDRGGGCRSIVELKICSKGSGRAQIGSGGS